MKLKTVRHAQNTAGSHTVSDPSLMKISSSSMRAISYNLMTAGLLMLFWIFLSFEVIGHISVRDHIADDRALLGWWRVALVVVILNFSDLHIYLFIYFYFAASDALGIYNRLRDNRFNTMKFKIQTSVTEK